MSKIDGSHYRCDSPGCENEMFQWEEVWEHTDTYDKCVPCLIKERDALKEKVEELQEQIENKMDMMLEDDWKWEINKEEPLYICLSNINSMKIKGELNDLFCSISLSITGKIPPNLITDWEIEWGGDSDVNYSWIRSNTDHAAWARIVVTPIKDKGFVNLMIYRR